MESSLTEWMKRKDPSSEFKTFHSHIFFKHKLCVIHLVVFQRRNQYFWHAALDVVDREKYLPLKKLLLTSHDGAYEK